MEYESDILLESTLVTMYAKCDAKFYSIIGNQYWNQIECNHRNEVVEEVHDEKKMVMGQCKIIDNLELKPLNVEAMSYLLANYTSRLPHKISL